jgi:hypothetical protein
LWENRHIFVHRGYPQNDSDIYIPIPVMEYYYGETEIQPFSYRLKPISRVFESEILEECIEALIEMEEIVKSYKIL